MKAEPREWLDERVKQGREYVERLLRAEPIPFGDGLRAALPERPGIYAIFEMSAEPGEILRAGKARGAGGLRQRIYMNHFMGNQAGNLRSQLVRDGICSSLDDTKPWIRANCRVHALVIDDPTRLSWAEYFMLATLRPKYCD